MKKLSTRSLILGSTLALAVAGTAYANQTTPGIPGTPGCRGQTIAYIAQLAKNPDRPDFAASGNGIGGVSKFTGLSNKQIQDVAVAYCAQTPPTP